MNRPGGAFGGKGFGLADEDDSEEASEEDGLELGFSDDDDAWDQDDSLVRKTIRIYDAKYKLPTKA